MVSKVSVVVIGAGASGLPAIKTCIEEGLDVVCFEKTKQIGGVWRFRESVHEEVASVMRSTIINSSKEASAYSDFPPPPHFPNFMHNTLMVKYFEMYAEHFNLYPHIRYSKQVLKVEKSSDFPLTGEWIVTVKNLQSGEIENVVARAVMVCNGHLSHPNIPKFEGLDAFKGEVMHTHTYKDFNGFENKRVLVVGIGNSGGDIAVELSRIASQVYLSTRSGTWVLGRVAESGAPLDTIFLRRFNQFLFRLVPRKLMNFAAEFRMNMKFNHELYNLKPNHSLFAQHPMVNDDLPNRILSGTVAIKGNVSKFTENSVIFQGEENNPYEIDAIILATGYRISFPFLGESVTTVNPDNSVCLYKFVFPPNLERPTLAIMGLTQTFGAIMPITEIQCRWVTRVFKGLCVLPSRELMLREIIDEEKIIRERYAESPRHTIQVDVIPYGDGIADMIGAKPNLLRLALTDVRLFLAVFFGPYVSYHYRLQGPHPWPGARNAILDLKKRIQYPLQTNYALLKSLESSRNAWKLQRNLIIFVGITLFISFILYFFM